MQCCFDGQGKAGTQLQRASATPAEWMLNPLTRLGLCWCTGAQLGQAQQLRRGGGRGGGGLAISPKNLSCWCAGAQFGQAQQLRRGGGGGGGGRGHPRGGGGGGRPGDGGAGGLHPGAAPAGRPGQGAHSARYISALHAVPQITHARRLCGLFTARDT